MHITNNNFLDFYDFDANTVKTCLQKAHLSVMVDDGKEPFTADYTRCAAFDRYRLPVNWEKEDFLPQPTTTSTTTTSTTTTTTTTTSTTTTTRTYPNEFEVPTDVIDSSLDHCSDFSQSNHNRIFGGKPAINSDKHWPFLVQLHFLDIITGLNKNVFGTIIGQCLKMKILINNK